MNHITFRAMGTDIEAWTTPGDDGTQLMSWFEEVESVCSRFRETSAVSMLNESNGSSAPVDGILAEVLEASQSLRDQTGGLVDVGAGAAVRSWGYSRSFDGTLALDHEPGSLNRPNWHIRDRLVVRSEGVEFDLGGTTKGWTCDRAVDNGLAVVVSAGGDIRSSHPDTTVPVMDPWGDEAARISLGVGALATSSQTKRSWRVSGSQVSHIIDPRTMRPTTSPVLSATVVAATALEAEAGAKAVLLLGESGLVWADSTAWIESALVVWHDGSVYGTGELELAS